MKYADPYTPGAGFMPGHIAGRKETLERAGKIFEYNCIRISSAVRDLLRITLCRKDGVVKCNRKNVYFAMAKCEKLPCSISNVAKIMETEVSSISPYRAQLINKKYDLCNGICGD